MNILFPPAPLVSSAPSLASTASILLPVAPMMPSQSDAACWDGASAQNVQGMISFVFLLSQY
jgi:hypothetical protein